MSEARRTEEWTWEAYLEWEAGQPTKHELVDGQVYAMTGGSTNHDTIANNLRAELRTLLRGKACRPQGPDIKVKAGRNGRYPDALIDCGPRIGGAQVAQEPVAVFEVLSKATAWIDQTFKLRDYNATPRIRTYVPISETEMRALVYTRDANGRLDTLNAAHLEGPDAAIEIPDLGITLPFTALYEDVDVPPAAPAP